jgi:dihydrodiol dehydrogenase / D-xylose 1-dehydrogenase (NADP)
MVVDLPEAKTKTARTPLPAAPPLDDPTISSTNYLDCPPLRWGLIGCGRVSHDFCRALRHVPTASVVACAAARDVNRAQKFAKTHAIPKAYGDYDELVQNDEVQIVYVGNVHAFRRAVGEKCLLANKHVLLEKPFACTASDAEYLIGLAKQRNLFLMEGMWTRFFPAVETARQLVSSGELGDVVTVCSDFNFAAADSEEYPSSFVFNRKLGGGASLLVGPYPIAAATLFFPNARPDQIKITGLVDPMTGVDLCCSVALSFPSTSNLQPALDGTNGNENTPKLPGSGVASLSYGMLGESDETTTVVCTRGRITIHTPGHCPTRLTVRIKGYGRGAATEIRNYHFPLPDETPEHDIVGDYFYPNSAGFCYEAAAVARCIHAGKTEAPQYTLADTMVEMDVLDQARSQLGFRGVNED